MGSWDETCAISNFPIAAGDKVKVILLEECASEPTGKNGCYSTEFWGPVTFPLSGVYDDYGRTRDIDYASKMCGVLLKVLQPRHIPVELGKNKYHDIAVPNLDNMDILMAGFEEGRVQVKHRYRDYLKNNAGGVAHVCRVYIREDVWNMIAGMEMKNYRETISAESVFRAGFQYFKEKTDYFNSLKTMTENARVQVKLDALVRSFSYDHENGFMKFFTRTSSGSTGPTDTVRLMEKKFETGELTLDDPNFLRMLKGLSELAIVSWYLQGIRYTWYPTTGSGSQECDFLSRADFHSRLAQIAVKNEQQHRKEYDVEDDKDHFKDVRTRLEKVVKTIQAPPKKRKSTK